jgi:uncharacterized protein YndB with AHSA1/START domain
VTMDATLEHRDGAWVLTLQREFAHPVEVVWPWLTDPARLARWSPIVPNLPFDGAGARQVREQPGDEPIDGEVISVDPPRELIHRWGEDVVRWRLAPTTSGCLLTLEQTMQQRDPAAMNAAGWDVCLTVLDEVLGGADTPRATGPAALERGWAALRAEYAEALECVD